MKASLLWFLFLFFLPMAHGTIILSPGVSITNAYQSDEKSSNNKELITFDSALGIALEAEWTTVNESIGLSIGALWRGSEAISQYFYTNPNNPLDTAKVDDLDTNSSSLSGFLGPRFRFLNLKYFKIFAGAGWTPGILYLNYNESKFKSLNGGLIGFKEKEQKNYQGTYFELGMELYSTKGSSVKLLGRSTNVRTERFQTLGNKKLNLETSLLTLQYMHLF